MIERELGDAARVVFTDRHGGLSAPPFASLNLGNNTADDPAAVAANLEAVRNRFHVPAPVAEWVRMEQVHGTVVVDADSDRDGGSAAPVGDAAVTSLRRRPVMVMTADCAPIALAAGRHVAVVHAGWRGLVGGVIAAAVEALRHRAGPIPIHAILGPCIHPGHYEFGPTELAAVAAVVGPEVRGATESGAAALDLPAGVRMELERAGVKRYEAIDVCTYASDDHFSYRRDGTTGRQAVLAWIP